MNTSNDCQISGVVTPSEYAYKRYTMIIPIRHKYDEGYYKYTCPICNTLNNRHQVTHGEPNCTQCGVNLFWSVVDDE